MTDCTDGFLTRRGIVADETRAGGEYLYVRGELLVAAEDVDRVAEEIERLGGGTDPDIAYRDVAEPDQPHAAARDLAKALPRGHTVVEHPCDPAPPPRLRWRTPELDEPLRELGQVRFYLPDDRDAAAVARLLRCRFPDAPPRVSVHQALGFEPFYRGGPGSMPAVLDAADAPEGPYKSGREDGRVSVAVLDTGIDRRWDDEGVFGSWFAGRVDVRAPDDHEVRDDDGDGVLDLQAGHGTFIAGIVAQAAPEARITARRVLTSFGLASDAEVALAIRAVADHDVINLSLGGYSQDDRPTPAIVDALRTVSPDSVVVAAAGNAGSDRLFWPAALKQVVAVGAHEGERPARACFSNYGWWVDCNAPGVDVPSRFVTHDGPQRGVPDPDAFDTWAVWSGTSFAAPRVAGLIAALAHERGIPAREAARLLVHEPAQPRLDDLGIVIR